MLAIWFDSPLRIQALRDGPSGPQIEGFAQELYRAGYARITARRHIREAEHFVYWSNKEGVGEGPVDEQVIQRFGRHLSRCRCPGYGHTYRVDLLRGARLFLGFLRGEGLSVARLAETQTHDCVLLAAFCQWMRQQRGTADSTLYNYKRSLRDLLARVGEDPGRLDAQCVRQFVLETSQKCGWAATKNCTTALRMFLRFLIAEGRCPAELGAAVPTVAHWRLSSLPRYLQSEEVERVIASCDPTSAVGKRDRAILLLLARLGLRAGDIVQLRLGDIDWKGAWLSVTGKSRRETRLPLTQEVGQAVVDYLQDGRPRTDSDALFVRARAPFRAFANHCAVSVIVERAMLRSGVKCPSRGAAHVLRHSAASSMLRHGASLQDIAAVLRHRSIDTTQIYAKVDVTMLGQIAQPWPGARPC
ncbi:site-specific integrase [Denitromonas ohlonensis]|nr:site-specific integrase [Denitromonas ohlonensis]